MDSIISAALEEICIRGSSGIPLPDLWTSLRSSLSSAGLHPCDGVKRAIWYRLLNLPCLRFQVHGSLLDSQDPSIQSLEESEKLGLRVVAEEHLRDSFLGIYDLKVADAVIPPVQRRVLEQLAMARTNGITQSELAKENGIKGNNIFYIVRNLECKQLIVRQSTTVRMKESGSERENEIKNSPIVNTNLIHLYRYAKTMNSNSQQRIEITRPYSLDSSTSANKSPSMRDDTFGECVKEDVRIRDYLPALKAICDKLEESSEKVLVVSDIKLALGYRKTPGHRAWRNILNRLKDAGLVEEFPAKVHKRVVSCLRLLKKFDPKDFQPKIVMCGYDGFDSEHLVKHGKRGHITDQLVELPLEHRIYDVIDAEGPKGITFTEVCKRLGLNPKSIYTRFFDMCKRFGIHMQAETPNKARLYRVWTSRNFQHYSTNVFPSNCEEIPDKNELSTQSRDLVPYDHSSPTIQLLDSCSADEPFHPEETHNGQIGFEPLSICSGHIEDNQIIIHGTDTHNLMDDTVNAVDDATLSQVRRVTESKAASERPLSVSSTPSMLRGGSQRYPCLASTVDSAQREQRILKILKNEKFILAVELHRWLEGLEKDKSTVMDRKTLTRTVNRLQQEDLCKCYQVSIPVLTNCSRKRTTDVILHPSVEGLSSELLDQIHKRQRLFDIQSRARGSTRSKNDQPVTVITGLKRPSNYVDAQPPKSEAMRANGFVPAKMIRAKLLHYFLWEYLCSLPDWCSSTSGKHGYDPKNPHSTCKLFALDAVKKAMPLELFLQVVGSAREIDGLVERCRHRLRLSDLSLQEYRDLMDTQSIGRLSRIIDILHRLKLIQLVAEGSEEDAGNVLPHAVLTHALELKPYVEEPLPRALLSSNASAYDLRPRVRHDFVLTKKEAVDAYWETLEYCYAAADSTAASQAFPGSAVDEVFHPRSWASVRVMTAEQRMELLKRVANFETEKISFKDCVRIARELNLTLEQVLRVSYDKRQFRLHRYPNSSKPKEKACHLDANNNESVARKRNNESVARKRKKPSKDGLLKHMPADTGTTDLSRPTMPNTFDADEKYMEKTTCSLVTFEDRESCFQACEDDCHVNVALESDPREEDGENCAFISQCAFSRLKPMRRKRFSWTDNSDRQLLMQYARYRATLGARFYRVDWPALSDLPALPDTCRRRMAVLNSNGSTRRAVMRLCNLLGERYAKYLHKTWKMQEKQFLGIDDSQQSSQGHTLEEALTQNFATDENFSELNFQEHCWDDFEDPNIKMLVDEVLRCKRMAKLECGKRVGSKYEKEWPDIPPADGTKLVVQACGTLKDQNNITVSTTSRSRSKSHRFPGKFIKLVNSRDISIRRQVSQSLAVANAVELLKLVFLSTSAAPEVQTLQSATLQLYSEHDLFAAFKYLQEKNFMVIGHGSQPVVLSQKFWHNVSSSPFPIDSGKRAASFSSWLHKQENDLMEDGVNLTLDIQCGEIFHLFALVSSGELFISPCLPEEGIGEADEPKSLKSCFPIEGIGSESELKSLKRRSDKGKTSSDEKVKKHKPLAKIDSEFCSRREKGFPGIKVFLNRAIISSSEAVEFFTDIENNNCATSYDKKTRENSCSTVATIGTLSLSRNLNSCHEFGSATLSAVTMDESFWGSMTTYAALMSSSLVGWNQAITFSTELFRDVHSAIHQAGEQGLRMEEISQATFVQGKQLAEIIVDTLEVFRLAVKVNAFDCVRAVDSSYRSKYFINTLAYHNHDLNLASYMEPQVKNYEASQQPLKEKHETIYGSQKDTIVSLCDGHKVTILDLHEEPAVPCIASRPTEEVHAAYEACMQVEAVSMRGDKNEAKKIPSTGDPHLFRAIPNAGDTHVSQPILPWINGDGSRNIIVYKGLTRRVLGTVMQNPGLLEEDLIRRMDVLNPQSCRRLLETMVLDNHIIMRMMHQTNSDSPPAILRNLLGTNFKKPESVFRKHFFANPMSTSLL